MTRYFPEYGYGAPPRRQSRTIGKGGKTTWLGSASPKVASKNAFVRIGTETYESSHGHGTISYPYVRLQSIAVEDRSAGMAIFGDEHPVDGWYSTFRLYGGSQSQTNDYRLSLYMKEYDAHPTKPGYGYVSLGIYDWTGSETALEAASFYLRDDSRLGYIQHYGQDHYFYDNPQHNPSGTVFEQQFAIYGDPFRIVQVGAAAQNYNLNVVGSLSKSSGSFDIEHPTVQGKRLRHSFIEGPQADLIYRGTAKLGAAPMVIDMDTEFNMTPGTWEAMNCTPWSMVSASGKVVEWEFEGSTLTITGDEGTNCMWMVIGERHDAHMKGPDCAMADAHGHLIVEYDEPEPLPAREPVDAEVH